MKTKEFLTALFGTTYQMPADKVASLFTNEEGTEINDASLQEYLSLDATRVKGFTDKNQEFFNNGQAKATKELMTDFEKTVKEKHGVNSDKKGLELIDELITIKTGDKTTIEENKVKAHPAYISLQDQMTKKVSEVESSWKEKYDGHVKTVAKKETLNTVFSNSLPFLDGYGLPEDATLRANQLNFFKADLEAHDWEPHEKDYIIKTPKGEVVTDPHGNRVTHEKFVHQTASKYWPKKEGRERSGAGGDNNPGGKGQENTSYKGVVPNNDTEYSAALLKCQNPADKISLTDAYNAKKSGAAS